MLPRRLRHSPALSNGFRQVLPSLNSLTRTLSSSPSSSSPPQGDPIDSSDPPTKAAAHEPSAKVSIDRSGLYNPSEHSHEPSSDSELVKHLKDIIKFRGGPISIAEYMEEVLTQRIARCALTCVLTKRRKKYKKKVHEVSGAWAAVRRVGGVSARGRACGRRFGLSAAVQRVGGAWAAFLHQVLTNPKAGFYINRDVFGSEGDFITSPEVSQMFGEMIGVWTMCLWEQMGQPQKVNLIELGPGRGTFMADLLRGASKFEKFTKSLNIHMIECSPTLQKLQYQKLKCTDEDVNGDKRTISMFGGAPVSWNATLEQVPPGLPLIIIGHEFYDALPIHQFQKASRGWCEKMVDVADDSSFRFVLSPQPTPATLYLMKRYKWATKEEIEKVNHIEVSPRGMELTHAIAKRIGLDGGGALIIDYGQNGIVSDSLQVHVTFEKTNKCEPMRAPYSTTMPSVKHKFVDILDDPGSADLSAYVDFASIRHSAEEASEDVSIHGPITQSQLLGSLGINFRVEALMQNCTDEQAESLSAGYWQLVGDGEAPFWEGPDDKTPIGMGSRYLAMAIVNKKRGVRVPFS